MARFNILFLALAACLMLSSSSRAVEAREIVAQEGVLLVGSNKLEWGIRSVDSGYFYFHRPSTNLTDIWEFAPCTRAQLSELKAEDLRCDFFGPNDLGGPVAFSKNWQERSIIINHRDLLLARVSSQPGTVYALKILFEKAGVIRLSYIEFQTPEAIGTKSNGAVVKKVLNFSIGGVFYSNIVVESVSTKTVTFSHSQGLSSVNPLKLTSAEKEALGLLPKTAPVLSSVAKDKSKHPQSKSPNAVSLLGRFINSPSDADFVRNAGAIALAIVGVCFLFYAFGCLCFLLICKKADHPSPLLVWIPFLQIFAIYRAAGMPSFWFKFLVFDGCFRLTLAVLAMSDVLGPLPGGGNAVLICMTLGFTILHVIGWCIWCFKICIAREKNPLLGLLVLFPITQPLALAYLAFSK